MESSTQFPFRAPESFVRETTEAARLCGMGRSEYVRQAIEAANARAMHDRIAALSRRLVAQSATEIESLDGAANDGIEP